MKKLSFRLFAAAVALFVSTAINTVSAQTAKQVLDRCAANFDARTGVKANFSMESTQWGNTSGTIAIKGKMFHASTKQAAIWFDGKTQWTYMSKNDEVNVITPTEEQQQSINPYTFLNLYKQGYKQSMTTGKDEYNVHLTSTDPTKKIKEIFLRISTKNYEPKEVKILQGSRWTTFTITNFTKATLDDSEFRFNAGDYPTAEVIDLR